MGSNCVSLLSLFAVMATLSSTAMPLNQWESVHPSGEQNALGGGVRQFEFDGDANAYVTSSFGNLFRRSGAAEPWMHVPFSYQGVPVTLMRLDIFDANPQIWTAVVSPGGVIRSLDGGQTWVGLDQPDWSGRLFVAPSDENTIYLPSPFAPLRRSTDGGLTWSDSPTDDIGQMDDLAIDPTNPDIIYVTSGFDVYRSVNGGVDFALTQQGIDIPNIQMFTVTVSPTSPQALIATGNAGVYRSSDGAATWTQMVSDALSNVFITGAVFDPNDSNIIHMAGRDSSLRGAIVRSVDGGDTWEDVTSGPSVYRFDRVDAAADGTVYTGGAGGISVADPSGLFVQSNSGFSEYRIDTFARSPVEPAKLYLGSSFQRMARGSVDDNIWSLRGDQLLRVRDLWPDPNLAGHLLAATGSVRQTFDDGETWASIGPSGVNVFFRAVTSSDDDPNLIFASGFGQLWRTTDGGLNWDLVLTADIDSLDAIPLEIDPHNTDIVYVGTSDEGLLRSTDGGNTWQAVAGPTPDQAVKSVTPDPATPGLVYLMLDGESLWRSFDYGSTWTDITNDLPQQLGLYHVALDPFETGRLFLSGGNSDLFVRNVQTGGWLNVGRPQAPGCAELCQTAPDPVHRGRIVMNSSARLFQYQFDSDNDELGDDTDNCTYVTNPSQLDSDNDGIGNACDADIAPAVNDCVVNVVDLGALRVAFFATPGSANWNPAADFNGDNVVNVSDLGIMRSQFFSAPGPTAGSGCQE